MGHNADVHGRYKRLDQAAYTRSASPSTPMGDYLPHMYGAANYVVTDEVRELPFKVANIYLRPTI